MSEEMTTITMYGTTWCGDCRRAKAVFQAEGVAYQWIDLADSPEAVAYVEQVNKGRRSVPTIIFPDGDILVEPSSPALTEKLRALK